MENKLPKERKFYDLGVRVNSVETDYCQDDLKTILSARNIPNTILLPKVEDKEHLKWVRIII